MGGKVTDANENAGTARSNANDEAEQQVAAASSPEVVETEKGPEAGEAQPIPPEVAEAVSDALAEATTVEQAAAVMAAASSQDVAVIDQVKTIEALKAELEKLKTQTGRKPIASGSKPRPNVVYTLLKKPPAWHSTPQVAQLEKILFDPSVLDAHRKMVKDESTGQELEVVQLTEPELFAVINAGFESGKLRTRQPPVRIFQYYRSELLKNNALIYK